MPADRPQPAYAMLPLLVRCAQEIAAIELRPDVIAGTAPAWLATLGVNDWVVEAGMIAREGITTCHQHCALAFSGWKELA